MRNTVVPFKVGGNIAHTLQLQDVDDDVTVVDETGQVVLWFDSDDGTVNRPKLTHPDGYVTDSSGCIKVYDN